MPPTTAWYSLSWRPVVSPGADTETYERLQPLVACGLFVVRPVCHWMVHLSPAGPFKNVNNCISEFAAATTLWWANGSIWIQLLSWTWPVCALGASVSRMYVWLRACGCILRVCRYSMHYWPRKPHSRASKLGWWDQTQVRLRVWCLSAAGHHRPLMPTPSTPLRPSRSWTCLRSHRPVGDQCADT